MNERIRESEVLKRLGISRTKLYRLRIQGIFPDPVRLNRYNEYYVESVERAEALLKDLSEAPLVRREKALRKQMLRGV